jgi:hypothetical protein
MAVMGDGLPEKWADELRRNRRVVFPLRPRAVLGGVGWIWLVVIATQPLSLSQGFEDGEILPLVLGGLLILFALGVTGWYCWRLATHSPALTVDELGIRVGRKKFLPWNAVGAIGLLRGGGAMRTLPIIPKDPWGKELGIPHAAARDMKGLQQWLEELLKEHRSAERSNAESPD